LRLGLEGRLGGLRGRSAWGDGLGFGSILSK
jgi:hypothetical protein